MAVVSGAGALTAVNLEVRFSSCSSMLQSFADYPWLDLHLACCGHRPTSRNRSLGHSMVFLKAAVGRCRRCCGRALGSVARGHV